MSMTSPSLAPAGYVKPLVSRAVADDFLNTVVTLMFVVSISPAVSTAHGKDKGETTID
jgi:hypothetical protein